MNISPSVQLAITRALLQVQKHAPAILTTVGVASVVTAGILAAKNTLKLEGRIDAGQTRLQLANDLVEEGDAVAKHRSKVYIRNVVEVSKLYVVPAALMAGGILCILNAQNILNKRNAALAAAYNGLAASYGAYRIRVREEVGEELENDIYLGQKTQVIEDKKGNKTAIKVPVDGEHVSSPYRFNYDSTNDNWTGFHDENLFRLQIVQNMYNDILKTRGHVFLRDVLNTLGIKDTPASCITGWIYNPTDDGTGDNFIEFNVRDFQQEYGYILLDFNVDGTIFDRI